MTEEQLDALPNEYIKKFGTFIFKAEEMQAIAHDEINKDLDMYKQIKGLRKLKTQAEIDAEHALMEKQLKADTSFQYELENYMKRQPRIDFKELGNYNFEQFREYTTLYESAKKRDTEELRQFYKMVKYAREFADKNDKSAMAFAKQYRLDLIEIPLEFQEEGLEDIAIKKDKRTRRPIIRLRSSRDISKYDAWRCYDRQMLKGGGKQKCIRKIDLIPADLVKAFGLPAPSETGFEGSGEYNFEDSNLDIFNISDYKKTQHYWGLNRPEGDAYYNTPANLRKPPHKRSRPWPTVQEFWESTEPKEFKLSCQSQGDFRKFRVWLRKVLKEVADQGAACKPYSDRAAETFGHEVDICLGTNYEEVGKVNTDIAIFKYDFTYFLPPDELKKLKGDRAPPPKAVAPKSFDLTTAERVVITKEELKQRELMEQEKLKDI